MGAGRQRGKMKTKTEKEFKLDEKILDGLEWLGEPADFLLIEDVREFIKEILGEIRNIKNDWESGIPFCNDEREKEAFYHTIEDLANLIQIIKQKAGEKLK